MKKTKIMQLMLVAVMLVSTLIPAVCASDSATLKIKYDFGAVCFAAYRVADMTEEGLVPTKAYQGCDTDDALALSEHTIENGIAPDAVDTTDTNGEITFSDLAPGKYLILAQTINGADVYVPDAALAVVEAGETETVYISYSEVDIPTPPKTSIAVQKIWITKDLRKIPMSIDVTLICDGEEVDTVTLNPLTFGGWAWVWYGLDADHDYLIKEEMSDDWSASIAQVDGIGGKAFVIYNTYIGEYDPDDTTEVTTNPEESTTDSSTTGPDESTTEPSTTEPEESTTEPEESTTEPSTTEPDESTTEPSTTEPEESTTESTPVDPDTTQIETEPEDTDDVTTEPKETEKEYPPIIIVTTDTEPETEEPVESEPETDTSDGADDTSVYETEEVTTELSKEITTSDDDTTAAVTTEEQTSETTGAEPESSAESEKPEDIDSTPQTADNFKVYVVMCTMAISVAAAMIIATRRKN